VISHQLGLPQVTPILCLLKFQAIDEAISIQINAAKVWRNSWPRLHSSSKIRIRSL